MVYPIVSGAGHREDEPRWNRHQQHLGMDLDFTDYNQQRYAAMHAARACRTAPPALAPPRSRWAVLRSRAPASRVWFGQRQRGE